MSLKSLTNPLNKSILLILTLSTLLITALFFSNLLSTPTTSLLCSTLSTPRATDTSSSSSSSVVQLQAIVHYATSTIVPQQSFSEISVTFDVLKTASPCNFLVFGLGHDSMMWNSLNPRGNTVFIEEDPKWVETVLKDAPMLQAYHVKYRTQLQEADELLRRYKKEPNCSPTKAYLRGNYNCKLALTDLPDKIYDTEWDLIMLDAPRGYFPEAPGRMAVIFSAAVMARARKGSGVTHIFLHDINRRVEKMFAEEFLCRKYLVKEVGRLWHFEIPPTNTSSFC